MKKLIVWILVLCMVMTAFAGCGKHPQQAATEKHIRIPGVLFLRT